MVEGLLAAAEMAEFMADRKGHEALRCDQKKDVAGGRLAREVEQELRKLVVSLRTRAAESTTGEFIPVESPDPGWAKKRRRTTSNPASAAKPRKRRKTKAWWSRLMFWK